MIHNFHLPEVKSIKESKNAGVLSIEPLYPGYGMTLGNSLRRVLLSSLPGVAVTAIKVEGAMHEFSTIPNIKEDVIEIILNLKNLRFRLFQDSKAEEYMTLNVSKEGKVKASDIKAPSNIEIINPDLHIAIVDNPKGKLNIEMKVETGRGYVPVEKRADEKLPAGWIAVDALYSPVLNVNYSVEKTRVGQMTNLEKLVISIETTGTITPKEALMQAAEILVDHLMIIAGKKEASVEMDSIADNEDNIANISVEEMNFSPRTTNALVNNDIKTVGDVLNLTKEELSSFKGLGNKAIDELMEKMNELGIRKEK